MRSELFFFEDRNSPLFELTKFSAQTYLSAKLGNMETNPDVAESTIWGHNTSNKEVYPHFISNSVSRLYYLVRDI